MWNFLVFGGLELVFCLFFRQNSHLLTFSGLSMHFPCRGHFRDEPQVTVEILQISWFLNKSNTTNTEIQMQYKNENDYCAVCLTTLYYTVHRHKSQVFAVRRCTMTGIFEFLVTLSTFKVWQYLFPRWNMGKYLYYVVSRFLKLIFLGILAPEYDFSLKFGERIFYKKKNIRYG